MPWASILSLCPYFKPTGLEVCVVRAYMDDSADTSRSVVWALGGFMMQDLAWDDFEASWSKVLRFHRVPYLHMNYLAQRKPPYEGWVEERAASLLSDLVAVIGQARPYPLCSVVHMEPFRRDRELTRKFKDAYSFALADCILEAHCASIPGKAHLIVDRLEKAHGKIQVAMDALEDLSIAHRIECTPAPLRQPNESPLIGIQAADFIAYEMHKLIVDSEPDTTGKRKRAQRDIEQEGPVLEGFPLGMECTGAPAAQIRKSFLAMAQLMLPANGRRWDGEMLSIWRSVFAQRYQQGKLPIS